MSDRRFDSTLDNAADMPPRAAPPSVWARILKSFQAGLISDGRVTRHPGSKCRYKSQAYRHRRRKIAAASRRRNR
jgi:hypothetical protein